MLLRTALGLAALAAAAAVATGGIRRAQQFSDFTTPVPLQTGNTLVIGFLGGWEPWDNELRWARKIALRLREKKIPGVYAESAENHRRYLARELVRRAFPNPADARLIIYGQSFGGAAAVKLARELERDGYSVLLTIQVDSVGRGDTLIPRNVAAAANFYQTGWPIRGESAISPEDPARTRILVNRRFEYRGKHVNLSEYPWFQRWFRGSHTKMDADPEVWAEVEKLILEALSNR